MRHLPVAIYLGTPARKPSGRRRRRPPRIVWLAVVVAVLAVPVSQADAKPMVAHFKVSFDATQDVTWKEKSVAIACDGGATVGVNGKGRSRIRVQTPKPVAAKAIWLGTKARAVYFQVALPVTGTYFRTGRVQRSLAGGKDCSTREWEPKPARDCGTRRYPRTAVITAGFATPDDYPTGAPAPLVSSMYISGPWVSTLEGRWWVPFRNCPARDLNGVLGVVEPSEPGADTGAAPLSIGELLRGRRHITLHGSIDRRTDLIRGLLGEFFLSGTIPVKAKIRWTLRLTRVEP